MKTLKAQALSATGFAAYGSVIDAEGATSRPINQGSSQRVDGLGELALTAEGGSPCLAVFRARAQDPHGPWHLLERHRLGSQTFIPLQGARSLVLVALGADVPDPATLAAFTVAGHQGYTLHPGTWHHGLVALDEGDFVVIERRGASTDCDELQLAEPVRVELS